MEQVPVRVLNQDTASVLARVERGETVEITRHGKVIGRIVPAVTSELDGLIAAGKVAPATVGGPFSVPSGEPSTGTEAGELIRQLRDEERW
ncbi:MAG: type II toxin-antitoxin system Phd/YefM family antitoxin [Micromonosporaceae bacterium]